jgi:hypothetical protein
MESRRQEMRELRLLFLATVNYYENVACDQEQHFESAVAIGRNEKVKSGDHASRA